VLCRDDSPNHNTWQHATSTHADGSWSHALVLQPDTLFQEQAGAVQSSAGAQPGPPLRGSRHSAPSALGPAASPSTDPTSPLEELGKMPQPRELGQLAPSRPAPSTPRLPGCQPDQRPWQRPLLRPPPVALAWGPHTGWFLRSIILTAAFTRTLVCEREASLSLASLLSPLQER